MVKPKKSKKAGWSIPVAPIMGLAAGLAQPIENAMHGNYFGALEQASLNYTGYSIAAKNWEIGRMKNGILPLVIGLLVHKFVGGKLGINRMLAQLGVPIRI